MISTHALLKLQKYNQWLYSKHLYDEGPSNDFHRVLTASVVKEYIDPLHLDKNAKILDLGCGPGYFLDEMQQRGYTSITGVTLSQSDYNLCQANGHKVVKCDMSFLPDLDRSIDFIFLRHALEHSPYPILSLIEYNRVLRVGGKIYIEVPQPNCDRLHEFNLNHYSILGHVMLAALLQKTEFSIDVFNGVDFDITDNQLPVKEKYYCILATKQKSLDINLRA